MVIVSINSILIQIEYDHINAEMGHQHKINSLILLSQLPDLKALEYITL